MFILYLYYFISLLFISHRKIQKSIDEGHFHVSLECTLQAREWDLDWWQANVHIQKKIHFKEVHLNETNQQMQLVDLKKVLTYIEE